MGIGELLILAVGVSMDAFAVSICKGLAMKRATLKASMTCGVWFGGFQALMPLIGYSLGIGFSSFVAEWDHWIAWTLLTLIGINMLRSSLGKEDEAPVSSGFTYRVMLPLAIATSIDALAIGVSFAFLSMRIWMPVLIIGFTTMLFSFAGVYLGRFFGTRFRTKAEFVGGLVLIAIGCKILWEHTM